jgi:hypothetical protein
MASWDAPTSVAGGGCCAEAGRATESPSSATAVALEMHNLTSPISLS